MTGFGDLFEPGRAKQMDLEDVAKKRQPGKGQVERYQWMRNAEGGQEAGNQQTIQPLTEELYAEHVAPRSRHKTLAEHLQANPQDTHINLIRRADGKVMPGKPFIGPIEALRPQPENPAWVRKVDRFDSKEARKQAQTADGDETGAAAADVRRGRPREAGKKPEKPLQDAGEELWYNRRNLLKKGLSWDDLKDLNETLRYREATKARAWPRMDYEKLVEAGMQPMTAWFVKRAYDAIPTKPAGSSDEQIRTYVEAVGHAREKILAWARDTGAQKRLTEWLAESAEARMRRGPVILGAIASSKRPTDLIDAIFPTGEGVRRFSKDNPHYDAGRARALGNRFVKAIQPGVDDAVRALKEIEKGWPKKQEAWQRQGYRVVRKEDLEVGYYNGETSSGKKYTYLHLKEPGKSATSIRFDNERQARAFYDDLSPWLALSRRGEIVASTDTREAAVEALREAVRRRSGGGEAGAALEKAVRRGEQRRQPGQNVTAEDLMETFGFRGVNYGNWVKGSERQEFTNHAYDALLDLADLLDVPPKAISLNGMLGLAFGAQGRGGKAAAHFVPGVNEINLTKTAGAGSLAHEWAHALDHYFGTLAGLSRADDPYLTHTRTWSLDGVRPEVLDAFRTVVDVMKSGDETPQEHARRMEAARKRDESRLDRWLGAFRDRLGNDAKDKEKALRAFDALAGKIRKGDLGDPVKIGRSDLSYVAGTVAEIRALIKKETGHVPMKDTVMALNAAASAIQYQREMAEQDKGHQPQKVASEYLKQARKLDREKGGKRYWSQPTEMFARAFQSWALDRLRDRGARNDFLTHPQAEPGDTSDIARETRRRYPQGTERERVNRAFDTLIAELQHRETDQGIALFSRGPAQPAFYSQLERVVEDKLPGKGTGKSYADMIRAWVKKGEIKAEEVEWSGIMEWLQSRDGKLTRDDVLRQIRQNEVVLEEKDLGGAGLSQRIEDDARSLFEEDFDFDGWIYEAKREEIAGAWDDPDHRIWKHLDKGRNDYLQENDGYEDLAFDDFSEDAMELDNEEILGEEQTSEYWAEAWDVFGDEYRDQARKYLDEYEPEFKDTATKYKEYTEPGGRDYRELLLTLPDRNEVFTTPHFDEPNILVHIRFDERTDTDGNRVLFIEEIQSDWHQEGRKKGYKENLDGQRKRLRELQAKPFGERTEAEQEELDSITNLLAAQSSAVPDAPFKATWPLLAMKRMIRWAAENGYDRVAWTTGEQQTDRYNLAKHVDSITVDPSDTGARDVIVHPLGAEQDIVLGVSKDGVVERASEQGLSGKPLDEVISKDMAEKIMAADEETEFEAEDLRIGGTGMSAFYDKILPSVANKYIKKWGAKVSDIEIESPTGTFVAHAFDVTPRMMDAAMAGQPLFRASAAVSARPLAREELDAILDRITAGWSGANRRRVVVVDRVVDLPPAILQSAKQQNVPLSEIHGASWGGRAILVRENMTSPEQVEETLFHEAYGHLGVSIVLGSGGRKALNVLWRRMGGRDGLERLARAQGVWGQIRPYVESLDRAKMRQQDKRAILVDELLAHVAGKNDRSLKAMFKEYLGALRVALRKLFTRLGLERMARRLGRLSDSEMMWLLKVARDAVRGKTAGSSSVRFMVGWHGSPHDHSRFSTEYIGSGEGAIAYGWGLYFAGSREVGEWYKMALTDRNYFDVAGEKDYLRYDEAEERLAKDLARIHVPEPEDAAALAIYRLRVGDFADNIAYTLADRSKAVNPSSEITSDQIMDVLLRYRKPRKVDREEFDVIDRPEWSDKERTAVFTEITSLLHFKNPEKLTPEEALASRRDELRQILDNARRGDVKLDAWELQNKERALKMIEDGQVQVRVLKPLGRLYQVNIAPREEEFLDWDKPYSQQPEKVKDALNDMDLGGQEPTVRFQSWLEEDDPTGDQVYERIGEILAPGEGQFAQYKAASKRLLEAGVRGNRYLDGMSRSRGEGHHNYVVFDDADVEILAKFSRKKEPIYPDGDAISSSVMDELIFKLQDKMHYLRKAQEATGHNLTEEQDAYLKETLYHGRVGAAIEDFQREHVDPLLEQISKAGLTVEEVDEFLHARHAPEANAQLKRINPDREDNEALSGMSDEEAAAVMARFDEEGKLEALKEIGRRVDEMTAQRRRLLVKSGLEKPETIQAWEKTYRHYVPLYREGHPERAPRIGRGFDMRGREKRRAGSNRAVKSILAHLVAQNEATIIRAEKARVSRALLEFVRNNPNPDLYTLDKVEYKPHFNKDGLVTYRPDNGYTLADNVLVVRENGADHRITFNEQNHAAMRIARAMKNLGADDMGAIMRGLHRFTRFLAMLNTSVNPEFVISNFARDLQTAGYNLSDNELGELTGRIIRDTGKAWRGIRAFQKGRGHPWAKYYDEFRKAGAKTGWLEHYRSIEDREKALIRKVENMGDGTAKSLRRGLMALDKFIEDENTAVENAVRLSAYVHARKSGMSVAQAAKLAKELTVNFNRKGEMGAALNALYMFYNASLQGSVRIFRAMGHKKVRRLVYATVVAAAILDMLNRTLGGDDDDGIPRYDKIPDYIKERNLIIVLGDKGYLKIPLPWGYNVFHVIGQEIGSAMTRPGWKASEGALRTAGAALDAFNPLSSSTFLQFVLPTILDPFAQWAENKNWYGGPIRPPDNPFGPDKPASQKYFNSVREPSKWVAQKLNELTGGDDVTPGKVDVSPEFFDLMIDTLTGGAGRFVSDLLGTPAKFVLGEDVEPREIPLLRKVYGQVGATDVQRRYYEWMDQIDLLDARMKGYRKQGRRERLRALRKERQEGIRLIPLARKLHRDIGNLRRKEKAFEEAGDTRKARVFRERRMRLMRRFVSAYYKRVIVGQKKTGDKVIRQITGKARSAP